MRRVQQGSVQMYQVSDAVVNTEKYMYRYSRHAVIAKAKLELFRRDQLKWDKKSTTACVFNATNFTITLIL